jgi:hypothetical protein
MTVDSKITVSPRVWTAEELARVWPLPDGWTWSCSDRLGWHALAVVDVPGQLTGDSVSVAHGRLRVDSYYFTPTEVALAVIGAHQGRDSVETLAVEVDRLGTLFEPAGLDPTAVHWAGRGRSRMREAAAMLRRGTVAP